MLDFFKLICSRTIRFLGIQTGFDQIGRRKRDGDCDPAQIAIGFFSVVRMVLQSPDHPTVFPNHHLEACQGIERRIADESSQRVRTLSLSHTRICSGH